MDELVATVESLLAPHAAATIKHDDVKKALAAANFDVDTAVAIVEAGAQSPRAATSGTGAPSRVEVVRLIGQVRRALEELNALSAEMNSDVIREGLVRNKYNADATVSYLLDQSLAESLQGGGGPSTSTKQWTSHIHADSGNIYYHDMSMQANKGGSWDRPRTGKVLPVSDEELHEYKQRLVGMTSTEVDRRLELLDGDTADKIRSMLGPGWAN